MKYFLFILLLLPCPASATYTLAHSQSSTCAATTSCVVTLPGSSAAGNLFKFDIMWGGTTGTPSVCDGGSCSTTCTVSSDTFNQVTGSPSDSSDTLYSFYGIASGALTSFTFCISGGGSHTIREAVYEWSSSTGFPSLATVLDTSNTGSSASAVPSGTGGNITPAATGELILSAAEILGAQTFSISGTGYVEQPTSNGTAGTGWVSLSRGDGCSNTNSPNTATTCTFTFGASTAYAATIAAFKPASVGGTVRQRAAVIQR